MKKDTDLCFEVISVAKTIFKKGLVDNWEGNVSIRSDLKQEFYITPTLNNYLDLTEEKVVHMDFNGTILSNGTKPSTEAKMHSLLYNNRKKVRCIIHTHSLYATILSINHTNIPIIMEEQVILLGGSVEISEYKVAHTEEIGKAALIALNNKNAALLANHGAIICGKTVEHAIKFAEFIEKLSKIYWGALQIGKPQILSDKDYGGFLGDFKDIFSC